MKDWRPNILIIAFLAVFMVCFLAYFTDLSGEALSGLATAVLVVFATLGKALVRPNKPGAGSLVASVLTDDAQGQAGAGAPCGACKTKPETETENGGL